MSISRRSVGRLIASVLPALAVPNARAVAQAVRPKQAARVAFLSSASTIDRPAYWAFRTRLRELGWIEGQNLELAFHLASGAGETRLEPLARMIADARVDAVLGDGRVATLAIAGITQAIPIVSVMGLDPVPLGLARSLAYPGRNVTGISLFSQSLNGKRLQILRDMAPDARRCGVVFGSAGRPSVDPAISAGTALGLDMRAIEIQSLDDLAKRLAAPDLEELDAFLVTTDGFLDAMPAQVVQILNRYRRPAIYPDKPHVEAGGLASYGVNYSDVFERLAVMIDRVLRGATPATMPFEQPERFDLTLNQQRAREIGLAFPPLLLAQAREVLN